MSLSNRLEASFSIKPESTIPNILKVKLSDLKNTSSSQNDPIAQAANEISLLRTRLLQKGKSTDSHLCVWQHFELAKRLISTTDDLLPTSTSAEYLLKLESIFGIDFIESLRKEKNLTLTRFIEICQERKTPSVVTKPAPTPTPSSTEPERKYSTPRKSTTTTRLTASLQKEKEQFSNATAEAKDTKKIPDNKSARPKIENTPQFAPQLAPAQVLPEHLKEKGNLHVTLAEEIKAFIQQEINTGNTSGLFTTTSLKEKANLKQVPSCGVIYKLNKQTNQLDIYWIYENNPISSNPDTTIMALQKENENIHAIPQWYLLKIKKHEENSEEFETAKQMGIGKERFVDKNNGKEYIIMDWLPGDTLTTLMKDKNSELRPIDWMKIFSRAARAVKEFHAMRYLHRDLTPDHFLVHNGEVRLIGFKCAKKISEYDVSIRDKYVGTHGYLSPKWLEKGLYNFSTDLYALGITTAEALGLISPETIAAWNTETLLEENKIAFLKEGGHQLITETTAGSERLEALRFVRKMITSTTDTQACEDFFTHQSQLESEKLQQQKSAQPPSSVYLISINEFIESTDPEKSALILESKKYDKVLFLDPGKGYDHPPKKYLDAQEIFKGRLLYDRPLQLAGTGFVDLKKLLDENFCGRNLNYTFVTGRKKTAEGAEAHFVTGKESKTDNGKELQKKQSIKLVFIEKTKAELKNTSVTTDKPITEDVFELSRRVKSRSDYFVKDISKKMSTETKADPGDQKEANESSTLIEIWKICKKRAAEKQGDRSACYVFILIQIMNGEKTKRQNAIQMALMGLIIAFNDKNPINNARDATSMACDKLKQQEQGTDKKNESADPTKRFQELFNEFSNQNLRDIFLPHFCKLLAIPIKNIQENQSKIIEAFNHSQARMLENFEKELTTFKTFLTTNQEDKKIFEEINELLLKSKEKGYDPHTFKKSATKSEQPKRPSEDNESFLDFCKRFNMM